jgi:hypothetical protein
MLCCMFSKIFIPFPVAHSAHYAEIHHQQKSVEGHENE